MQKVKTHTLIVRGVKKINKNKLKKHAKVHRLSVNSVLLNAIDSYLEQFEVKEVKYPYSGIPIDQL